MKNKPHPIPNKEDLVPFTVAQKILADRLNATPQEIAIWVWLDKLQIFECDKYMDGNYKISRVLPDFVTKWMGYSAEEQEDRDPYLIIRKLYFKKDELKAFIPDPIEDRYLTYSQVVERIRNYESNEMEIRDLIEDENSNGYLDDINPTGFDRKIEKGIFWEKQVVGIETEYWSPAQTSPESGPTLPVPVNTTRQNR